MASIDDREHPEPPALAGSKVRLRNVLPHDLEYLYELATNNAHGFRWRYRGQLPRFSTFVEHLMRDSLSDFQVVTPNGTRAGYVVAYGSDSTSGHVYIGTIMDRPYVATGMGVQATLLFLEYLFATWPFHKVYFEVPEYNLDWISKSVRGFLQQEGVLREHLWYGDRRWNVGIYAVYRSDWYEHGPALLEEAGRDDYE